MNRRLTAQIPAILALVAMAAAPSAEGPQSPGEWERTFAVGAADLATVGENPYFILRPGSQLQLRESAASKRRGAAHFLLCISLFGYKSSRTAYSLSNWI